MGPRSCERGNASESAGELRASCLLQWGRARASAEIPARRDTGREARNCFNGAALVRARKLNPGEEQCRYCKGASMGPRSCERGNNRYRLTRCGLCGCFNGAALVRARKCAVCRGAERGRVEASMGPRSCERGNQWQVIRSGWSVTMLQWGRARASAEISLRRSAARVCQSGFNGAALVRARKCRPLYSCRMSRERASMGPRSCERGNRAEWARLPRRLGLQWGRARASAEIAETATPSFAPNALQWGRARASAEMGGNSGGEGSLLPASMGPRSCERGNILLKPFTAQRYFTLQWGRARASAEIRARRTQPCWDRARFNGAALVRARKFRHAASTTKSPPSLQWGRARASAEMTASGILTALAARCFNGAALVRARKSSGELTRATWPNVASMGPRSCERGNPLAGSLFVAFFDLLQWGRARASAEIRPCTACAHRSCTASMGPRSCERGNAEHRASHPVDPGFNGAALVRARK